MDTMNVKIDDLIFDRGHYDAEGDVLYLGRGDTIMRRMRRSRRRAMACATTTTAR
jgi:hypothetical protein